jgi:peptide/nickel transport system substrate-binding protein
VPPLAAIAAEGDHVVRVRTIEPNPTLPEQLSSIGIMSKAWAERHGAVEVAPYTDAETAYVEDHANGTGPFVLEAYEPGARTVLIRNAEWWGLAEDPHNIDRVIFTAVADPAQRVAALLAGEIDFLHDPPFTELDRLATAPGVRLEQAMEFRTISSVSTRAAPNFTPRTSRTKILSPICGSGRGSIKRSTSRRSAPGSCAAMPCQRAS